MSRKMVVRVEDLVRWAGAESAAWGSSMKPAPCGTNGLHKTLQSSDGGGGSSSSNGSSEPLGDKLESKKMSESPRIKRTLRVQRG